MVFYHLQEFGNSYITYINRQLAFKAQYLHYFLYIFSYMYMYLLILVTLPGLQADECENRCTCKLLYLLLRLLSRPLLNKKALKNAFKPLKYCYFFFEDWFKIKTKYCNIIAFYKTHGVYLYTSGTIFSADVWINGGQVIFSIQTWCIPLESFASKNELLIKTHLDATWWSCVVADTIGQCNYDSDYTTLHNTLKHTRYFLFIILSLTPCLKT